MLRLCGRLLPRLFQLFALEVIPLVLHIPVNHRLHCRLIEPCHFLLHPPLALLDYVRAHAHLLLSLPLLVALLRHSLVVFSKLLYFVWLASSGRILGRFELEQLTFSKFLLGLVHTI